MKLSNSRKCDGGENGGTFVNEPSCMAGSGQRNPDRYGGEMYADSARCGGENPSREKPICPAARLYLMNQAPLMKSKKTKCATQGNVTQQQSAPQDPCWQQNRQSGRKSYSEDPGKKCNYSKQSTGKTCASPSSARPPCTCSCPREEKETREPCPKKKSPSEKSCSKTPKTTCPDASQGQRRPQRSGGMDDGTSCNAKPSFQMPFDEVNHVEGCTCLDPPQRLEGLNRLGLGKTTPDPCITDVKPPQQQQQCMSGRRKGAERQDKRQSLPCQPPQEEAMPAPCLKTRTRIMGDQKPSSCPPPRTKPSNACCPQMKMPAQDNYGPPRPEYGANSCGAKIPDVDMGTCAPPPCGERTFPDKRYETEVKNLQYTQNQQECGEAMGPSGKRQFMNDAYGKEEKQMPGNAAMLEELIAPVAPREFIDVLSSSSAEEAPPGYRDGDGQDEAGNTRGANKYDDCAGEDDDDDGAAGYASSLDNDGNAGQNFDDYEGNECQKPPPRRRPCPDAPETQGSPQTSNRIPEHYFMPCTPSPTPYNSPPQNYNQPGQTFGMNYGAGNAPYAPPYNSPNYNGIPAHYFQPCSGSGSPQNGYNPLQSSYNQQSPGQYQAGYGAGTYNPPQVSYSQIPGQTFTIPCGAGNQSGPNAYGPPQANQQQFLSPNVCGAPSRQRQTPDMSREVNRRAMSIDPRDFPQSFAESFQLPGTSTPLNATFTPSPPNFPISPLADTSGSPWMRLGGGRSCQRTPAGNESPARYGGDSLETSREWVSLRSAKRSTIDKSCSRGADQSSDAKRQIEPDSLMQNDTGTSSMGCQHGSYAEESPKWRELPKSTRFQRNLTDGSCYK